MCVKKTSQQECFSKTCWFAPPTYLLLELLKQAYTHSANACAKPVSSAWAYVDLEVGRKPLSGAFRNATSSEVLSPDFSINAVPADHPDIDIDLNR